MDPKYGVGQRPRAQFPIEAPTRDAHHEHWIIGLFTDSEFSLLPVHIDDHEDRKWTAARPYSELWQALAGLPKTKTKQWLIGHRVRYALEQADFLVALEQGNVSLPRSKKKGQRHKRAGKLASGKNCLEIDIVAGRNQIKILDWKNFGIEPKPDLSYIDIRRWEDAYAAWANYLAMCRHTGMVFAQTTAAQTGWRHARVHHAPSVLLYNLDPQVRAMERRAYFGGRNEAFRLGDIPDCVMSLDVKSCYAAVCLGCDLPVYMEEFFPLGLPVEELPLNTRDHWIADVVVSTPSPDYPLSHDGITIYPTGTFCTALAWPELHHALARGRVDRILRAGRYRSARALTSYAQWYLAARQLVAKAGLTDIEVGLKCAFNGSLGYTARQRYELIPWAMDIDKAWWLGYTSAPDHSAPIVHAQVLDGVKEWLKIGGEPREAMPFLHATICSWARMNLLEIMEAAGREWIHYCDTDGILVDYRGYANLVDTPGMLGPKPGQLGERFKSGPCRIQGQKNYRIGAQVICSGLVRTRDSVWQQKRVLETPTGRTDSDGRVSPFSFRCEDIGDIEPKYFNIMN